MKNIVGGNKKKIFFILSAILLGSAFAYSRVFSYDSDIAHPYIADWAALVYNDSDEENKLSLAEIKLLRQGSIEEDTPIRWMNHFYDPVYGKGLTYKGITYNSAKNWAQMPEKQRNFSLGDYTWQRAIYDYKNGDKDQALIGLGHIIHLVSDMGVPAHTRDDSHPEGDSYEQFVKYNYSILQDGLENLEMKMFYFDNLNEYFDDLANYSNNNFYSDGTIENGKYKILDDAKAEYVKIGENKFNKLFYTKNENSDKYYLYSDFNIFSWSEIFNKNYYEQNLTLKHELVLTSYTKHLFPKAVGYSAGIIKLFFEEVKKEHDFEPPTRMSLSSSAGYLFGKIFNVGASVFDVFKSDTGVVKADPNTVLDIMTKDTILNTETVDINLELAQTSPEEIVNSNTIPTQPKNEIIEPVVVIEPPIIPEPIQKTSDIAELTDERFLVVPPRNDIEPQPPKIELPKPTEPKQEKYTSEPQFVFGPGGEKTPSVPAPAPIVQENIITTTTENITEIATTTEDIIETPTSTEEIVLDITAPDAPNLTVSFIISTSTTTSSTIDISWQSTTDDLFGYNFDFQKDSGDWVNIFTLTTSTQYQMNADKFHEYSFRVNATDTSTNTSNWSEKFVLIDYPKTVVINEIAWMGTASNRSQDEWIELYNNTDQDINLASWKIKATNNYFTWNNASSTIKARDYYLLERTGDTTVSDILADRTFTLSGGLNNTGENLLLSNNNGEIIDQVDNTNGWFAGQTGAKYKTMERINSNKPGTQANNWQTSDTFSYKGKGQGGVRIYGTPRQPNKGYWYLQNLTTNYTFDENNTLTLTEENNPYFIDAPTEIPAGYTLKLKEGVIVIGAFNSSNLIVKGNLIIEGTPEKPVIFTSARDTNYVPKNYSNLPDGNPEAGDWSRIEVTENGKLTANNVKFLYGGQKYFAQGGFVFGGKWPARIINNLGGEVNLDHATFQNSFTNTEEDDKIYDALIWIEPATGLSATTTINNSVFDGGYLAIKNKKQNNYLSISNSSFANFTYNYGPVATKYDLPIMENNIFENNVYDMVFIEQLEVKKDMILDSNVEYLMSIITVDVGTTLKILPGTIINFLSRGSIIVNGSLEAIGTENNKIIVKPVNAEELWGDIVFTNSTSTLEYINLIRGNFGSKKEGVLWMKNSNVILNNVSLTDARRPYNMIYSKDSNLRIKDSEISWSTPKESQGWTIDGINLDGGYLYLNNTTFNQMDRGIELYNLSTIETENMTLGHFTNISDLNWWPIDAIEL